MKSAEWEILQKNLKYLREVKLKNDNVLGTLFESCVITSDEKDQILNHSSARKRIDVLLHIMKGKPHKLNAYQRFVDALKCNGFDGVVSRLEETIPQADPSLQTKEDPSLVEDKVRRVLLNHFTNVSGSETSVIDVNMVLQKKVRCQGGFSWKLEKVKEFVPQIFGDVIYQKKPAKSAAKGPRQIFKNLISLEQNSQEYALSLEASDLTEADRHKADSSVEQVVINNMNPAQLRAYLQTWFREKETSTDVPEILYAEQISGSLFLSLDDVKIKEIIPKISFGVLMHLQNIIEENGRGEAQVVVSEEYASLRKFGTTDVSALQYVKGQMVDTKVYIQGSRLQPICNFHDIQMIGDKEEAMDELASLVVLFVSACLNERKNGTIYFGIPPRADGATAHGCADTGRIVGLALDRDEVETYIHDYLGKCFLEAQSSIVRGAVQEPQFVNVVDTTSKAIGCWVVEVDVVPSSCLLQNSKVRTKLKYIQGYKSTKACLFQFSHNGQPEKVPATADDTFEANLLRNISLRKEEESKISAPNKSNLRSKFLDLFTGGRERLEDSIYPFLFLCPFDGTKDCAFSEETLQFIARLRPEAVFDFDPDGYRNGIMAMAKLEHDARVLTLENFDEAKESLKELHTDLVGQTKIPWVFCNGREPFSLEKTPTEWNKERRRHFEKCLHLFTDSLKRQRVLVMFCLTSAYYRTMLEGCEQILSQFPGQWILLAESESVAKLWMDQMVSRCKVDAKDLTDRCVLGMPWDQINLTIAQTLEEEETHKCMVPQSTGALVEIPKRKVEEWSDIEIVSAQDPVLDDNEFEKRRKIEERKFYHGSEVSWLNFMFSDQVLVRDIHGKLMSTVKEALENNKGESRVNIVDFVHQPCAGATTCAKQVLWELRKHYRCCIVRHMTENTVEQLCYLWKHEEKNPKPLLILIDNEEAEKCRMLTLQVVEKGRMLHKQSAAYFDVFCAILKCSRRSEFGHFVSSGQVFLSQKVSADERNRFKVKDKELQAKGIKANELRYLISYNMLKTAFNKERIVSAVKEFVREIKDENEIVLLTHVSLLNTYDPYSYTIPVSYFDNVFKSKEFTSIRFPSWEANLSDPVKVLLNLSVNSHRTHRPEMSLRIVNKVFAYNILEVLKTDKGKSELMIMRELIDSLKFAPESAGTKGLMVIIDNIMRWRDTKPDGKREQFSPFVLKMDSDEGEEATVELLEALCERDQDPFTAQLIARYYIKLKNWEKAEHYATTAVCWEPHKSTLWDTYSQVFKTHLKSRLDEMERRYNKCSVDEVELHDLIELTSKAVGGFRKEHDKRDINNIFAGHFGELTVVFLLLGLFEKLVDIVPLCQYLQGCGSLPRGLHFLSDDEKSFFQGLEKRCLEIFKDLDAEFLQVKVRDYDEESTSIFIYQRDMYFGLVERFPHFFGANTAIIERNLPPREANVLRWKRALNLGVFSFHALLKERNEQKLLCIYKLLLENVSSPLHTPNDLLGLLRTVTVLISMGKSPPDLRFKQLLEWTKILYDMPKVEGKDRMEASLFFVLFNFPTEQRSKMGICSEAVLERSMVAWRNLFIEQYPYASKREERTNFFLGNGDVLKDIVHKDDLPRTSDFEDKWNKPELQSKLRLSKGLLQSGGNDVIMEIETARGNVLPLTLPSAILIKKTFLWEKEVLFYLGFSFSGPKAFGIPVELPESPVLAACSASAGRQRGRHRKLGFQDIVDYEAS